MKEEWRDIKGYEGLYQVSNLGRVKALTRTVKRNGKDMHLNEKILKVQKNPYGYCLVTLSSNGVEKHIMVHRLVAEAFIVKADVSFEVNHIDENKANNRVDNLEWCTHRYNNLYKDKAKRSGQKLVGIPLSDERKRKISENNAKYWLGKNRSACTVYKIKHSHDKERLDRGFTDDVLREINRRANSGEKLKLLAKEFNCAETYIWKIKHKKVYLINGEW